MKRFFGGVIVGAVCVLAAYLGLVLPRVEENARISGFVHGAHLALIAVDDELTDALAADVAASGVDDSVVSQRIETSVRHVRGWRGCGIAELIRDWPGAYRRLQAIEALHPGGPAWHAHIVTACSSADLGDAK